MNFRRQKNTKAGRAKQKCAEKTMNLRVLGGEALFLCHPFCTGGHGKKKKRGGEEKDATKELTSKVTAYLSFEVSIVCTTGVEEGEGGLCVDY